MNTLCLNGEWTLYYALEQGEMPASIEAVRQQGWPSVPAQVPGNVEMDLVRAGVEKDPFYGENLYALRKYEFYQWWYTRCVQVPRDFSGQKYVLRFEGLDDVADVYVNGAHVGHSENMFVAQSFDVTDVLQPGQSNQIAVRICSALNHARKAQFPIVCSGGERSDEFTRLRKAPSSFGWDIMPRIPSAGLWRGVFLDALDATRLTEVYYATAGIDRRGVRLAYRYRFETDDPMIEGFSVRIRGVCGKSCFFAEQRALFVSSHGEIIVENPQLWWPKGYGEANLYTVTMELVKDGVVMDSRTERIGLRRIQIDHVMKPGDAGEFLIRVNGCPILAKGSNWVPLDAMHSRDAQRVKRAHDLLEEAGCNIIRCWGGNVYEDHAFFDLCDERGMLVWQDFAMACAQYPQDAQFQAVIEQEATTVIKKLRNHASILLWAGDNEVDEGYSSLGYPTADNRYNMITRETLPRVVRSHDPYRMFLPSSPYIDQDVARYEVPEQHNWGARAYFKDDFYKHSKAHFISECGYHGCPAPESLKRFLPPDQLWPFRGKSAWMTHDTDYLPKGQRGYDRNVLMAEQVQILFGYEPDTLEEFSLLSQVSQAEAKKFFIERTRIKKWRRTGIIWWNMLDGWPQISDAIVDYYFTKKRAFNYVKRVQRPVCLMMDELVDWTHAVVLGNDSRTPHEVDFRVEDADTGKTVLEGRAHSPANENVCVGEIRVLAGQQKLFLLYWTIDGVTYANHYITGFPPLNAERVKKWLPLIDALPT